MLLPSDIGRDMKLGTTVIMPYCQYLFVALIPLPSGIDAEKLGDILRRLVHTHSPALR